MILDDIMTQLSKGASTNFVKPPVTAGATEAPTEAAKPRTDMKALVEEYRKNKGK
jgi:hypothetical protein